MTFLELLPGLRRAGATAGGEFAGPCPWCGGTDRFRVWPFHLSGKPRFWCRGCGRSGDEIDLRRELTGASYREAADAAGQPVTSGTARPPKARRELPLCPPCAVWQCRAKAVAVKAEQALWTPGGARAAAYLHGRGFSDETIHAARLGYIARDQHENPAVWGLPGDHRAVWVPRGITVPWHACGSLWRLNVRRPAGDPKYVQPAGGSGAGLYGVDDVRDDRPVVLVEGELDALAIWQEAGDLVTPVATGSTCSGRHPRWQRRLSGAPVVLVAYDGDEPGEKAAGYWLGVLPRARRLLPEEAKDVAAMLEGGANVRGWVQRGIHGEGYARVLGVSRQ